MKNFFKKLNKKIKGRLARCRFLVLDFDGVLTDNFVLVDSGGKELVRCSRYDSMGLSMLKENSNVQIAILSKEKNPVVSARAKKLGVRCFQGVDHKADFLRKEISTRKILPDEVCYVGNDLNDLGCFSEVGLSVVVSDADSRVKKEADYVTNFKGGQGAVREICELILLAKKSHPFVKD